jgi:hypothetical protein
MAKSNKVKSYRPNLTEGMTIRFAPEWKARIVDMCVRHNISEAEVLRILLDVGLDLAETKGFHEAVRVRAGFLDRIKK